MKTMVRPVVLCGGSGTRLWPLSRPDLPKQFIEFPHGAETSTLFKYALKRVDAETLAVAGAGAVVLNPMVVGAKDHQFIIRGQLKGTDITPDVFLEPTPCNTAASLTMAALANEAEDPVLVVLPADQAIDAEKLNDAVAKALPICESGAVVLLGVKPSYPETGYGYILTQSPSESAPSKVDAFVEKPDAETAKRYLEDGCYLWNSGIFILKASTWLAALKICTPEIEAVARGAFAQRTVLQGGEVTIAKEVFEKIPKASIDYAVMEKCAAHGIDVEVIAFSNLWTDLGSWKSVHDASPLDAEGNFSVGEVVQDGCSESLMISTSRLVVGNGVHNIAVLEMPDAVLVTNLDDSQNIKKLVETLRAKKLPEAEHHRKGYRPWGYYDSIDEAPGFKVKRIVVYPGSSLSLQRHKHRAEHWTVVSGVARVQVGDEERRMLADESVYIPKGTVHRLTNEGTSDMTLIEVQTGAYLGEDDIERLEDVYGRA